MIPEDISNYLHLKLIVQVTYPDGALRLLDEANQLRISNSIIRLFFYGDMADYEERMAKVWRRGAKAEFFRVSWERRGELTGTGFKEWTKT